MEVELNFLLSSSFIIGITIIMRGLKPLLSLISFIFKASYDKANRSSLSSYRGPGLEQGLDILRAIKEELGVPVLSDVHETNQIEKAVQVLDVIQIPALLSRQTDLIVEASKTQKPLNLKKGQFMSPHEMKNVVEKALSEGNEK